jgi:penicillin-binding protein 1C
VLHINQKSPEPLPLAASAGSNLSKLYWYVNDRFYKTTGAHEKNSVEGPVKISCTDDKVRNSNIWDQGKI